MTQPTIIRFRKPVQCRIPREEQDNFLRVASTLNDPGIIYDGGTRDHCYYILTLFDGEETLIKLAIPGLDIEHRFCN